MAKNPLKGLLIRTAVVWRPDVGYILACDPKLEAKDIEHTIEFRWKTGAWNQGKANFSAHSCCIFQSPEFGKVKVAGPGGYAAETRSGVTVGNIFTNSQPPPTRELYGDIRSVSEIEGKAYAVGLRGMVYRLDKLNMWTRIDEGLPATFDIEAIHGFDASDIWVVGRRGGVWHFDSRDWKKVKIPTKALLNTVKCAGDGQVYIAGHDGALIRGNKKKWEVIEHEQTTDDIWDLDWFEGELYVSTMSAVYRLKGDTLVPVDFGADPPKTTYQLSTAQGVSVVDRQE